MFENKLILITGASKGLGKAIAKAFEKEGARLILAARSIDKLNELKSSFDNPEIHITHELDLLKDKSISSFIRKIEGSQIDVIIHSAGGSIGFKDSLIKLDDFRKVMMLNILSSAELNRCLLPSMINNNKGNVIHIGSIVSTEARASVAYNSAKAALAGYVKSIGREMSNHGVIVSGILPGAFYGDENAMYRYEKFNLKEYKKFVKALPEERMPLAEEYIPTVKILADPSSKVMSGSLISMDGGQGMAYFNSGI